MVGCSVTESLLKHFSLEETIWIADSGAEGEYTLRNRWQKFFYNFQAYGASSKEKFKNPLSNQLTI
jgi:hypothetical protein